MASTIVTKNSSTASAVPLTGDLTQGELAVNVTDKRLFTKNSGGTVVELGTNPASLALPNGTANGVAYLNGSKVVTTGSALTFDGTNLGVGTTSAGKNIAIYSSSNGNNGLLRLFDLGGTERLQLAGSSTGEAVYYSPAGSVHAWYINSEQMRLTSTGLGIGTSSPLGTLGIAGSATTTIVIPRSSNGTTATPVETQLIGSAFTNGTYPAGIYALNSFTNNSGNWLTFKTTDTGNTTATRMTLDSSGNLGLGVTPTGKSKFEVYTGAGSFNGVQVQYNASNAPIVLACDNSNGDGYIGQNTVQVSGTGGQTYAITNYATKLRMQGGAFSFYTAPLGTAGNAITFTQAMTLDASGNLLVGKTASSNLSVNGIEAKPSGYASFSLAGTTSATDTLNVYSSGASAYRFYVDMAGTIHATSTTISAISDIRFKENVRDLDAGLTEVMALKPRLYDWKEGKGANIKNARGFIAQEFEQVFPDLIDEWKDPAPEGEEPYKSVRQDLIPVLVKAIQEQQALIQQLQADVAALKGN